MGCHGLTDPAPSQRYPWGTITSGLPDPDAIPPLSNLVAHPGDGGVGKPLLDETWTAGAGPARGPQEAAPKDERGIHQGEVGRSVRINTVNDDPLAREWNDDGGFFPDPETGGPGGCKTRQPATLWGECGLGRVSKMKSYKSIVKTQN
ncbi:hypothetical protein NDU88_001667 [Pleurodeles waltl]|uniref:Uncharacterized protein n=1 Tax=Pleurodeles waltl TaxID=8319 RepID=A0AAV7P672_PLEWA|nr:hypothetical protein NDU88_001667 [Pleurodeles waltl]